MKKNFNIKYTEPNIKGNPKLTNGQEPKVKDNDEELSEQDKNLKGSPEEKASSENQVENAPDATETKEKNKSTARRISEILDKPKSQNDLHDQNPFLMTKGMFDPAAVIKTGYKMRVSYKQTLKLMAEMKKGYTIEALLDEALSDYIDKNPDARKAFEMMKTMMSA